MKRSSRRVEHYTVTYFINVVQVSGDSILQLSTFHVPHLEEKHTETHEKRKQFCSILASQCWRKRREDCPEHHWLWCRICQTCGKGIPTRKWTEKTFLFWKTLLFSQTFHFTLSKKWKVCQFIGTVFKMYSICHQHKRLFRHGWGKNKHQQRQRLMLKRKKEMSILFSKHHSRESLNNNKK